MGFANALDNLPGSAQSPRERLLAALEMYEEGVAMQRLALRRQYPGLSAEQLDRKLDLWLRREDSA